MDLDVSPLRAGFGLFTSRGQSRRPEAIREPGPASRTQLHTPAKSQNMKMKELFLRVDPIVVATVRFCCCQFVVLFTYIVM